MNIPCTEAATCVQLGIRISPRPYTGTGMLLLGHLYVLHTGEYIIYNLYTLYSTLYKNYLHMFALYLYTLYSLLDTLYYILYNLYSTLYTLYAITYSLHLYSILYILYSILCNLYSILYTIYSGFVWAINLLGSQWKELFSLHLLPLIGKILFWHFFSLFSSLLNLL